MVGGPRPATGREVLYRFHFPELPGALEESLTHLKGRWSISLFHYRNHGAAYGRVLAGFLVPESDQPEFEELLQATSYPYQPVNESPRFS
jgi:threonine dehydratase